MQFRAFDINDCEGLILAHSHRLASQRIAKGSQLTRTLIDAFIQTWSSAIGLRGPGSR